MSFHSNTSEELRKLCLKAETVAITNTLDILCDDDENRKSAQSLDKYDGETDESELTLTSESVAKIPSPQSEVKIVPSVVEPFKLTPNDTRDPSYSNLQLPYRVICRQRLVKNAAIMRAHFLNELTQHELLQNKAIDGVKIHRLFSDIRVRNIPQHQLVHLTNDQQIRLEQILASPYL